MQVGGKDVVILTCESCTKTPKQSACQAGPLESSKLMQLFTFIDRRKLFSASKLFLNCYT